MYKEFRTNLMDCIKMEMGPKTDRRTERSVSVLEVLPDGVAVFRADDGVIIFVNDAFTGLFGYTRDELFSGEIKFQDLFSPIYLKRSIGFHEHIRYTEYEMKRKNSQLISVALTVVSFGTGLRLALMRDIADIYNARQEGLKEFVSYAKSSISLVKFSFGETGPEPELGINTDSFSPIIFKKMGIYFMTAITQGNEYTEGLFGPLPVADHPRLLSMIFSYFIDARNIQGEIDPRFKGKIPALIAIIYPRNLESFFINRRQIRTILDNAIKTPQLRKNTEEANEKLLVTIQQELLQPSDDFFRPFERKMAAINEITKNFTSFTSVEEIFDLIAELSEKVLDFKRFTAWQIDRSINGLRLICERGYEKKLGKTTLLRSAKSIVAKVARLGIAINLPSVLAEDDYLMVDPVVRSELAVPILSRGKVVGVINVESEKEQFYSEEDVMLLETIATRAAIFIEREEVETRFEALKRLTRDLLVIEQLELKEIFEVIASFLEETFSFSVFAGLVVNHSNQELKMLVHRGYSSMTNLSEWTTPLNSPKSAVAKCARDNKSILIKDVKKVDYYFNANSSIKSELAVPICLKNKVIGVLNVESKSSNAFSTADQRLLEILSDLVSLLMQVKSLD